MPRPCLLPVCVAWLAIGAAAHPAALVAARWTATDARSEAGKTPFAAEPAVTERFDTVYQFHADGTGSKVDTAVIHIQTEAALRTLSVLSIPYAAKTHRIEFISVRVRKPDGTAVATPGSEVQDRTTAMAQAMPLYSDGRVAQLAVRGLAVGDRLEYQVRDTTTEPEIADHFFGLEGFGRGSVVLERSVELRAPASRYLQVTSPGHPAKISETGGERVYQWTGSQLRPTVLGSEVEPVPPDAGEFTPEIAWTTFHSWAEVGVSVRDLFAAAVSPTPDVVRKVNDLTFGLTTPRARADALYSFVSKQIRSIHVPLGQEPWRFHSAGKVLENQFGDSRDKAVLLVALLRAAHLEADLALLPSGREVEESVPAPLWFMQMGVVGEAAGAGEAWFDPISEAAAPGVLDAPLRDRQALVIPASGEATLRRTPADLPFAASTRFETAGSLAANGTLTAHVELQTRGDEELHLRQALRNLGPAQWDRLSRALAQAYGLPGEPSGTSVEGPELTGVPLHLAFELQAPSYSDWEDFRIVPLFPVLNLPLAGHTVKREVDLGGKRTETAVSRIKLPPGYSADLPSALHLHTAFADLDSNYRLDLAEGAATLVAERTFTVKQRKLTAAQWAEYGRFLEQCKAEKPWVQLTSSAVGTQHQPPASGENNPRAADLLAEASDALRRQDLPTATARLDEARGINPRQPFLWSSYAALARVQGKTQEAVEDDRREWQNHPEEAAVSHQLALGLAAQGNAAEAIKILEATLALNPAEERARIQLGELQAEGDFAAAEKTFRAGLSLAPESLPLKLALSSLLLRRGQRDQAGVLLHTVAATSQDVGELNDAAYLLAYAGLDLPLAEQASRRSIQMLNAAAIRGEGRDLRGAWQLSRAFLASWDTYGWILLKQGFTSEAEPWLRAAWTDGAGMNSGRHLAELLQRQGKATEASAVLRLGVPGRAAPPTAARDRGTGRSGNGEGGRGSGAAREFSLMKPPGMAAGTAVFVVQTSPNGAQAAKFQEGEGALATMESAVAKVDLHLLFPPGTPAQLLHQVSVHCGSGSSCTLVLIAAENASLGMDDRPE